MSRIRWTVREHSQLQKHTPLSLFNEEKPVVSFFHTINLCFNGVALHKMLRLRSGSPDDEPSLIKDIICFPSVLCENVYIVYWMLQPLNKLIANQIVVWEEQMRTQMGNVTVDKILNMMWFVYMATTEPSLCKQDDILFAPWGEKEHIRGEQSVLSSGIYCQLIGCSLSRWVKNSWFQPSAADIQTTPAGIGGSDLQELCLFCAAWGARWVEVTAGEFRSSVVSCHSWWTYGKAEFCHVFHELLPISVHL